MQQQGPAEAMEMNDVGAMLADTAERLFATHCGDIEKAARGGTWPEGAWAAIEESGLPLALVPEEHGGFGIPATEALALIRQTGRYALALPLAERTSAFLQARICSILPRVDLASMNPGRKVA